MPRRRICLKEQGLTLQSGLRTPGDPAGVMGHRTDGGGLGQPATLARKCHEEAGRAQA